MKAGVFNNRPYGAGQRRCSHTVASARREQQRVTAHPSDRKSAGASAQLKDAAALLATYAMLQVGPAVAETEPDDGLTAFLNNARTVQKAVTEGVTTVQKGVEAATPVVKGAVEAAAPVVKSGAEVTAKVATEAAKAAGPLLQSGAAEADKLLTSSGIDTSAFKAGADVASKTSSTALSVAGTTIQKVASFDLPAMVAVGGGAALVFLVVPAVFGNLTTAMRGFAGDISPAGTLNQLAVSGSTFLVDLRLEKDKEQYGCPDVPGSARSRILEVELVELERELRSLLVDPVATEAKMTAMQVAALKRLAPDNSILLMDKNGSRGQEIARQLALLGYDNVFVMTGGFEGRNGWVQSKMSVMPYSRGRDLGPVGTILSTVRKTVRKTVLRNRGEALF